MHKYEIITYWSEEDDSFVAEVTELAGCMADGSSHEEAVRNAHLMIDEWIATAKELGRDVPEPKGRVTFA